MMQPLPEERNIQKWILLLLRVSVIGAILLGAVFHNYGAVAIAILALLFSYLPKLIERRFKIDLPIEYEFILVLFIYASIFLGGARGFYNRFWWWDAMLHTSSGVLLGFVGFLILYVMQHQRKLQMSASVLVLFAFSFALAGGALWEIFEFASDGLFGTGLQRHGLDDTMYDLIVDGVGALFVLLPAYYFLKHRRLSPLSQLVKAFLKRNPRLSRRKSSTR